MQVPAQRRGLHETLISLETSSDVPAIFSGMGRGSTQEPPCRFLHVFAALLTQSEINFGQLQGLKLHQNLSCLEHGRRKSFYQFMFT